MLATLRYTICKRDIAIRFASDTSLCELQAPSPPRYTIYPHTFHYHVLPCHPPPNRFPAHSIQNLPKQPKPRDMMQAMLIRWRSSASERSLCDAYFFHRSLNDRHHRSTNSLPSAAVFGFGFLSKKCCSRSSRCAAHFALHHLPNRPPLRPGSCGRRGGGGGGASGGGGGGAGGGCDGGTGLRHGGSFGGGGACVGGGDALGWVQTPSSLGERSMSKYGPTHGLGPDLDMLCSPREGGCLYTTDACSCAAVAILFAGVF